MDSDSVITYEGAFGRARYLVFVDKRNRFRAGDDQISPQRRGVRNYPAERWINSRLTDCVKTPFMVRRGSPRTDVGH